MSGRRAVERRVSCITFTDDPALDDPALADVVVVGGPPPEERL